MEAIGTLAGGIAHDFNNILGSIIGYTELARDDSPEGSPVIKDLDKVLEASDRAVGLVKQILAFSRQGETEYEPCRYRKKSVEMPRPALPTTIEITQDIAPETGIIFGFSDSNPSNLQKECYTTGFLLPWHFLKFNPGKRDVPPRITHRYDFVDASGFFLWPSRTFKNLDQFFNRYYV